MRLAGMFVLGLGIGGGALLAVTLLAALGIGSVFATHGGDGVVHACVNRYTGQARIMLPGRPPTCSSGEVLVNLGDGSPPAENLNYTIQTRTSVTSPGAPFTPTVDELECQTGQTAISGGSMVIDENGDPIALDYVNIDKGSGPIGEPPTGWASAYAWTNPPGAEQFIVRTWVLCVS